MTEQQKQRLAELRGFLNGFEYVNGKDNHAYLFEVWGVRKKDDLDQATAEVFDTWKPTSLSKTAVGDWKKHLFELVDRWLLAFLAGTPHLIDRNQHFSLSSEKGRGKLQDHILDLLEKISPVDEAYSVSLESREIKASAHDDLLLVCEDVLLYFHFELCD